MTDSYRIEVPNIIDDLGLDPFERVLYVHYKRVCGAFGGVCYEAVRTTAQKTKMAAGMVTKARESLQARGLITTLARKYQNETPNIMIVDVWDLNRAYYLEIGRPNVDGWTVGQLREWVDSVHMVNAIDHNPSERSPDEDSHNKRSLHERSNDELSSSEQLPPEIPVIVHTVNDNEHNKDERSPGETKKESSSLESYPNKESLEDSSPYGEGGEPPIEIIEPELELPLPEVEESPPDLNPPIPEVQPAPEEPPPEPTKKKVRAPKPPAFEVYTQKTEYYSVTKEWVEKMTQIVGEKPEDLTRWGDTITTFTGRGKWKGNVQDMLDWYVNGIPDYSKKGPSTNGTYQRSNQQANQQPTGQQLKGKPTYDKYTKELVYPDGHREPVITDTS